MAAKFRNVYERNVFAQHFYGHYLYTKSEKKNKNTNCLETDFWKMKSYTSILKLTHFHKVSILYFEDNS